MANIKLKDKAIFPKRTARPPALAFRSLNLLKEDKITNQNSYKLIFQTIIKHIHYLLLYQRYRLYQLEDQCQNEII